MIYLKPGTAEKDSRRQIAAAESFLDSMDMSLDKRDHLINAVSDAISYGWTLETYQYLLDGIEEKYRNNSK